MNAAMVPFATSDEQAAAVQSVVRHMRKGGLIATPTETVYGLSCAPDPTPLARLAKLKEREAGQAFLVLVRDPADVDGVVWTEPARRLASAFWPGPLTLVLEVRGGILPPQLAGPGRTLAIRATPHEGVRLLLQVLGRPMPSTSANPRGQPPARSADAVYQWMRAEPGDEPILILDGGTLAATQPSTIVDCSGPEPRLLREGALERAELERIVNDFDTGEPAG